MSRIIFFKLRRETCGHAAAPSRRRVRRREVRRGVQVARRRRHSRRPGLRRRREGQGQLRRGLGIGAHAGHGRRDGFPLISSTFDVRSIDSNVQGGPCEFNTGN